MSNSKYTSIPAHGTVLLLFMCSQILRVLVVFFFRTQFVLPRFFPLAIVSNMSVPKLGVIQLKGPEPWHDHTANTTDMCQPLDRLRRPELFGESDTSAHPAITTEAPSTCPGELKQPNKKVAHMAAGLLTKRPLAFRPRQESWPMIHGAVRWLEK